MQVELVSENAPVILPMLGRSKGIHVSELIHQLCVRLGHYKERDPADSMNQCQLELGNAFEWAIIRRMEADNPGKFSQCGELELNGVFGTPDLLEPSARADHEIKVTWKSLRDSGPGSKHFHRYEWQLKAYLCMLGWSRGYLHVAFVNGIYEWVRSGEPKWRSWKYTFTEHELVANWNMLMRLAN